jgi:hypothetical protein
MWALLVSLSPSEAKAMPESKLPLGVLGPGEIQIVCKALPSFQKEFSSLAQQSVG